MPYIRELASPTGFLDLLTEDNKEWIEKRLKTYSTYSEVEGNQSLFDDLLVTAPASLKDSTEFTRAIAFDGSLSNIDYPNITALKIASVWKDLTNKPVYLNGALDLRSLAKSATVKTAVGLLPGRGIYSKSSPGAWDIKFREEFYQNLLHLKVPTEKQDISLLSYLRELLDIYAQDFPLNCPNCTKDEITFADGESISFCSACNEDIYFSDFLINSIFSNDDTTTQPMLIFERLMLHGLIKELGNDSEIDDFEQTLFIADGNLQFFRMPFMGEKALLELQKMKPFPALVSFMKTGRVQKMTTLKGAEEAIPPGHLAMVTSEVWKRLFKTRGENGYYGKAFVYRTENGQKWFSFMTPPKFGDPVQNAPILNDWSNYPYLRQICAFIEANQSDENGPEVATLEVIGRANKACSLPFYNTKTVLEDFAKTIEK